MYVCVCVYIVGVWFSSEEDFPEEATVCACSCLSVPALQTHHVGAPWVPPQGQPTHELPNGAGRQHAPPETGAWQGRGQVPAPCGGGAPRRGVLGTLHHVSQVWEGGEGVGACIRQLGVRSCT